MKTYRFTFIESDGSGNQCLLSGPSIYECIDYFKETRQDCEILTIETV